VSSIIETIVSEERLGVVTVEPFFQAKLIKCQLSNTLTLFDFKSSAQHDEVANVAELEKF